MPVCGNYLFFELPKKIVLNPKDGKAKTCNQVAGVLYCTSMKSKINKIRE